MATQVLGTLAVNLEAQTKAFSKDLEKAQSAVSKFSGGLAKMSLAAGAAFAGLSLGIKKAVAASSQQLQAERQLANAFQATGEAVNVERIKDLASELQRVTTFGDETSLMAASMLARFGATENAVVELLPRLQDMSAAMGVDLNTATQTVGKALAGQVGTLSRYSIVLSKTEKDIVAAGTAQEKLAVLTAALDKRFKGAAKTVATDAAGAMAQFNNIAGDLLEEIGFILDKPVGEFFRDMAQSVSDVIKRVQNLSPEFKAFIGDMIIATTKVLGIVAALGTLGIALKAVGAISAIALSPMLLTIGAVAVALAGVLSIVGAIKRVMTDFAGEDLTGDSTFLGELKANLRVGLETVLPEEITNQFKSLGDTSKKVADEQKKLEESLQKVNRGFATATKAGGAFDFGKMDIDEGLGPGGIDIGAFDFSELGESFGEVILEVEKAVTPLRKIADGLAAEASGLTGAMGTAGELVNAAAQGFAQGGPIGAFVAVIGTIATKLEAVTATMDIINEDLEVFFDSLSELFEPMREATQATSNVLQPIFQSMGKVFKKLGNIISATNKPLLALLPLFQVIGKGFDTFAGVLSVFEKAIGFVTNIMTEIAKFFVNAFNWVVEIFADIGDLIGVGNEIRKLKVDMSELSDTAVELNAAMTTVKGTFEDGSSITREFAAQIGRDGKRFGKTLGVLESLGADLSEKAFSQLLKAFGAQVEVTENTSGALDSLAETANEVSEALTNVPSGFKVALERFQATMVDPLLAGSNPLALAGVPGQSASLLSEDSSAGARINIEKIEVPDPEGLVGLLQNAEEFLSFATKGTSQATGAPYSVDRQGS